jgi:GntR family transcriptional regulator/MocR family aminotransferase
VDLHLALHGGSGLADQLYDQLRTAILDGRLRPGDALPSTRALAAQLAVSRNTVSHAYARLGAEGFLGGRHGSGTYVEDAAARAAAARRAPRGAALRPVAPWDRLTAWGDAVGVPAYDFRVGIPEAALFPHAAWRRLLARELIPDGPHGPHGARAAWYASPFGEPALRAAIARHVGVARAVKACADDVVVTSGAQQALDLVARVLVEPDATVAVEDPGYPMAARAFEAARARVLPVPVDGEGLIVSALPATARLVYVTPSHQFPTGVAMSLARRLALLAWADRRGAVIVEDDYDSEFRFGGRPLDPLQSLDRSGRVLYVGSFSKVLLPSLRLGYVIAPPAVRAALGVARLCADWYGATAPQRALARFIDEGRLARHVRAARREYQQRRERLLAALERELGDLLEPVAGAAGLHLAARFTIDVDAEAVVARARAADVAVRALAAFARAPDPPSGLVLGYGAIAAPRIDEGVRRLAAAIAACGRSYPSRPRRRRR